jgi:hypothetical protein
VKVVEAVPAICFHVRSRPTWRGDQLPEEQLLHTHVRLSLYESRAEHCKSGVRGARRVKSSTHFESSTPPQNESTTGDLVAIALTVTMALGRYNLSRYLSPS